MSAILDTLKTQWQSFNIKEKLAAFSTVPFTSTDLLLIIPTTFIILFAHYGVNIYDEEFLATLWVVLLLIHAICATCWLWQTIPDNDFNGDDGDGFFLFIANILSLITPVALPTFLFSTNIREKLLPSKKLFFIILLVLTSGVFHVTHRGVEKNTRVVHDNDKPIAVIQPFDTYTIPVAHWIPALLPLPDRISVEEFNTSETLTFGCTNAAGMTVSGDLKRTLPASKAEANAYFLTYGGDEALKKAVCAHLLDLYGEEHKSLDIQQNISAQLRQQSTDLFENLNAKPFVMPQGLTNTEISGISVSISVAP